MTRCAWVVRLTVASIALAASTFAAAQSTFRWVDAQGGVHYGDQPPPSGAVRVTAAGSGARESAGLPPALGRIARDYPVVLYVTDDCKPCALGRRLLIERGVPYTERSVTGPEDVDAFKALGFAEIGFPALSVGRERDSGFDNQTWSRLLDAAGYPAQSLLPAGWRAPAAGALAPAPASKGSPSANAGEDPSELVRAPDLTRLSARARLPADTGFRF